MEALQFDPNTGKLSLEKVPIPVIQKDDEVIVKVAYAGVCGTDLHIINGEFPCSKVKFTPGHEFSGIVTQIGKEVSNVAVGDRVSVDPQNWCTTCQYCLTGRYHLCLNGSVEYATGIMYDGGWADYCKVRARQVYKLPGTLTLKQGALVEPISCISWGVSRSFNPAPIGSKILITGAGIIGNFWSSIVHHFGHREVIVVEPSATRIAINKKMGTGFLCVTPKDFEEYSKKMNWKADVAIDCSGNGKAIEQAIDALNFSGKLCIFGVAAPETRVSVSPFDVYRKELTIQGSNINPFSMTNALGLMQAMGDKYLTYQKLGIEILDRKDYQKALSMLASASVSKVVFAVNPTLE